MCPRIAHHADGVAKSEGPLAGARGSEWRLCVRQSLPSRDREGAVDQPNSEWRLCVRRTLPSRDREGAVDQPNSERRLCVCQTLPSRDREGAVNQPNSEWRLRVCQTLPSRDREGAVDQPNSERRLCDCQSLPSRDREGAVDIEVRLPRFLILSRGRAQALRRLKRELQNSKNRLLARAARNSASMFARAYRAATARERWIGRILQLPLKSAPQRKMNTNP